MIYWPSSASGGLGTEYAITFSSFGKQSLIKHKYCESLTRLIGGILAF